jgi:predicted Zn-dependent peptidase
MLKYDKDKNEIYYFLTKDYVTIDIEFLYLFENTKKNWIIAELLGSYLCKTNEIYKNDKDIKLLKRKLYGAELNIKPKKYHNNFMLSFKINDISTESVNDNYFNELIDFFYNIIYKPNFANNKLDKDLFKLIKKQYIQTTENDLKQAKSLYSQLYYKYLLPTNLTNNVFVDVEEVKSIVATISDKDVIDFYNELFKHQYKGMVFGNLKKEEIAYLNKKISFQGNNKDIEVYRKENIIKNDIIESFKYFRNSRLYANYEIINFNKNSYYIYYTICVMLNGMNGPIFDELRTNLGVVYAAYTMNDMQYGVLSIVAEIDKNNYDIASKGIDTAINKLKDLSYLKERLEYVKDALKDDSDALSDSISDMMLEFKSHVMGYETFDSYLAKILNLKEEDIIKELNNFKRVSTFFFKGQY